MVRLKPLQLAIAVESSVRQLHAESGLGSSFSGVASSLCSSIVTTSGLGGSFSSGADRSQSSGLLFSGHRGSSCLEAVDRGLHGSINCSRGSSSRSGRGSSRSSRFSSRSGRSSSRSSRFCSRGGRSSSFFFGLVAAGQSQSGHRSSEDKELFHFVIPPSGDSVPRRRSFCAQLWQVYSRLWQRTKFSALQHTFW